MSGRNNKNTGRKKRQPLTREGPDQRSSLSETTAGTTGTGRELLDLVFNETATATDKDEKLAPMSKKKKAAAAAATASGESRGRQLSPPGGRLQAPAPPSDLKFQTSGHRRVSATNGSRRSTRNRLSMSGRGSTASSNSSSRGRNEVDSVDHDAATSRHDNRRGSTESVPGAFRMGTNADQDTFADEHTISDDTLTSSDASEVIVIPKASLVKDTNDDKDPEDMEIAETSNIPIVVAQRKAEFLDDSTLPPIREDVSGEPKNRSRMFRISVLVCLTFIALLLSGILFIVLNEDRSSSPSSALDDSGLVTDSTDPPESPPQGDKDNDHKWRPPRREYDDSRDGSLGLDEDHYMRGSGKGKKGGSSSAGD